MVSDYISGARGTSSRDAALARYREDGDKVTFSPRGQHTNARWLLIDDANHIHAAVGLIHGRNGWLVSTVEQCSSE